MPPDPPLRVDPAAPPTSRTGSFDSAETAADAEIVPVAGYDLLERIGEGGMGVVHKAVQVKLNRVVALKMVQRAGSKDLIRFLAEAEAVAAVRHPQVVQVFEYGESAGRPFLAMEFLAGGSLADRLKAEGPRAPIDAARLVAKLADGIQGAHDLGIVHRDIKPGNVLFDEAGEPKLTDFGLAKRGAGTDLTATQAILGTPAYMAPEQAKGETKFVGPAADVYALGVVLYECLTGSRPFAAAESVALLRKVVEDEPERPSRRRPGVPRDIELICLKCLAKQPGDRYATAALLAADLRRFAAGEPVSVRAAGPAERLAKWGRRNPTVATLTGLAAGLLVAGTGVSSYFAVESAAQAREASTKKTLADEKAADAAASAVTARDRALSARRHAYANGVSLALQAWEAGLVGRAVLLLTQQLPGPDEEDLRGFEWYYVWGLCHTQEWRTPPGSRPIESLSFAPNGKTIATADGGGDVRLWDAATGSPIPTTVKGQLVAHSPDGTWLATADDKGAVRLWDAVTGKEVALLGTHGPRVEALAFARHAPILVTANAVGPGKSPGDIKVWDAAARTLRATWPGGGTCVDVDGQGTRVVTGIEFLGDGLVRNLQTGAAVGKPFHSGGLLQGVSFSPDGKVVAYSSQDRTIYLADAGTGDIVGTQAIPNGMPYQPRFSPDGKTVAAGTTYGPASWNLATWQRRGLRTGTAHRIAYSPDGTRMASGESDGTLRLSRVIPDWGGDPLLPAYTTAMGRFADVRTAIGVFTSVARVWDPMTRTLGPEIKASTSEHVRGAVWAFHPTGRMAAASEKGLQLWDDPGGQPRMFPKTCLDGAAAITFSPDGRLVAVARRGDVAVIDAVTGEVVRTADIPAAAIAFAGSETLALYAPTSDIEGAVWLWKHGTDEPPAKLPCSPPRVTELRHSTAGNLAVAPGGIALATTTRDGLVHVWAIPSGRELVTLRGHVGPVHAVAFSADGKTIATGGQDMTVKLWQAATGLELVTLRGHDHDVVNLSFTADGHTLMSGSGDWQSSWRGTAMLWRIGDRADADAAAREESLPKAAPSEAPKAPAVKFEPLPDTTGRVNASLSMGVPVVHGSGPFRPGDVPRFSVDLMNATDRELRPRMQNDGGISSWYFGRLRCSVERLGPDPAIAALPSEVPRHGNRHELGVVPVSFGKAIAPRSMRPVGDVSLATAGFPPGSYRLHYELLAWDGSPISEQSAPFELLAGDPTPVDGLHLRTGGGYAAGIGFSDDGAAILLADVAGARILDARTGALRRRLGVEGRLRFARFAADGRIVTAVYGEKFLRRWDATTGAPLPPLPARKNTLRETEIAPDGRSVVCVDMDGTMTAYDTAGKATTPFDAVATGESLNGLAVGPDGKRACSIIIRDKKGSLRVWDPAAGKQVAASPVVGMISGRIAWSGDGKWIAFGIGTGIEVRHADTGKTHRTLDGGRGRVANLAFSRDGTRVAASCGDGKVRVWDTETGREESSFDLETDGAGQIAFSPDGNRLAATNQGTLRVWNLPKR